MILSNDRQYFFDGLRRAKLYSLEWEFIHWYKLNRRSGQTISNSISFALCEWDL